MTQRAMIPPWHLSLVSDNTTQPNVYPTLLDRHVTPLFFSPSRHVEGTTNHQFEQEA